MKQDTTLAPAAPTLEKLRAQRERILEIAASRGARNVRVFGSVARNASHPGSDVDFLVEMDPERSALDLSELILDLEEALQRPVDVIDIRRRTALAEKILHEAIPL